MWHLVAAESPATADGQTQIILAIIGLLSVVLVAAIGGLFSLLSARANRTEPAPPPPSATPFPGIDLPFRDYVVGELAVNRKRDDDSDERDEIQDRRLDQIERHLDLENPEWRHDGR